MEAKDHDARSLDLGDRERGAIRTDIGSISAYSTRTSITGVSVVDCDMAGDSKRLY